jgi:hypothetical protein
MRDALERYWPHGTLRVRAVYTSDSSHTSAKYASRTLRACLAFAADRERRIVQPGTAPRLLLEVK